MNKNAMRMSVEKIKELAARKIAENKAKRDTTAPAHSTPLNFRPEIHELISSAKSDQASASRLLEIAAEQIQQSVPFDPMLAAYFADAFKATVAQPLELQARELTNRLHLTSKARRPARDWLKVGAAFAECVNRGMSKNMAKAAIAADFEIDETTALKYYDQYVDAKALHDSSLPASNLPE